MDQRTLLRRFACLCLLAALLLCGAGARAEDDDHPLRIRIAVQPESLVEPGEATLSFTIENTAETDIQNIYFSSADGLISEPIGRIAAGEAQVFSRTHDVTADELDAGRISYIISHDDPYSPGATMNYAVHAQIRRSDVHPEVEFTRRFSSLCVESGDTLTIAYTIRNNGNVPLTDLLLQDALGGYSGRLERLAVGEARTFINRVSVMERAVSCASLSCFAENVEGAIVQTLADVTIDPAQGALAHSFSLSVAPKGDTAAARLELCNDSNAAIYDIRITDVACGGVIADRLSLSARGGRTTLEKTYPLRASGSVRWRVTARSASGKKIDFLTAAQALPERTAGEAAALRISADAATPRIRRAGEVEICVRIENPGDCDAEDIVLREETIGELRNFACLPAGESIEYRFREYVREDCAYSLSIAYADGAQRVTAAPVEIVIAADGVLPEGAKPQFLDFSGNALKIGGSSSFAVFLVCGFTALVVLVVLLAVSSHRARVQRRIRAAAEKQRRIESMGKAGAPKPARARQNKSVKGREV